MSLVESEDLIARIVEAAATIRQQPGMFECTSVSAVSLLAVYQGWWPNNYTSALNWYKVQLFCQNTSAVLLDFHL